MALDSQEWGALGRSPLLLFLLSSVGGEEALSALRGIGRPEGADFDVDCSLVVAVP